MLKVCALNALNVYSSKTCNWFPVWPAAVHTMHVRTAVVTGPNQEFIFRKISEMITTHSEQVALKGLQRPVTKSILIYTIFNVI